MKKIFLVTAIVLIVINTMFAQGNKSVFFELGGNGLGFSVNFDSRFTKSEKGFGFRAGIGVLPGLDVYDENGSGFGISTPTILTIPVAINHLAGHAPHYFESGLGITYGYVNGDYEFLFGGSHIEGSIFGFMPSVGYRYAKTGKGFQGRIFISPLIGSGGAAFWAGLSAGYKF